MPIHSQPFSASILDSSGMNLRNGELVVMPTETVYGLAALASSPQGVARVFEAKERPADDPLIVHVAPQGEPLPWLTREGWIDASFAASPGGQRMAQLIDAFWPGPLTLVVPRGPKVLDAVTAGLPRVALRFPAHPVAQALIRAAGGPLVAPSANRFGRISPTTAQAAFSELGDRVSAVLDAGPCDVGVESTVLGIQDDGELTWFRPGAISREDVARATGAPTPEGRTPTPGPQPSPGMLSSHYAPRTPLALYPSDPPWARLVELTRDRPRPLGVLLFNATHAEAVAEMEGVAEVVVLSPTGDPAEAAQGLYAALRRLDASPAAFLVAEAPPEGSGLYEALADRLRRASAGTLPLRPL